MPRASHSPFSEHHQGLSEDPLAQSQELVSTQHRERGPAFPGQRARVPALLRPSDPAAGGLLQVPAPHPLLHRLPCLRFFTLLLSTCADFRWTCSSLRSIQAGRPLKVVVPATSPRCPSAVMRLAGPATRPCVAAPLALETRSWRAHRCSLQTRRSMLRPPHLWLLRPPPSPLSSPQPRRRQI